MRMRALAAMGRYGIDPTTEPPPSVRQFVLNLGTAVNLSMQRAGFEPEALRWIAATLAVWEETTAFYATETDAELAALADDLIGEVLEHLAEQAAPPDGGS